MRLITAPEKAISGTLTQHLEVNANYIYHNLNVELLRLLEEDGDWTILQLGSGRTCESIIAKNVDGEIILTRGENKHPHTKGTSLELKCNIDLVIAIVQEMINDEIIRED